MAESVATFDSERSKLPENNPLDGLKLLHLSTREIYTRHSIRILGGTAVVNTAAHSLQAALDLVTENPPDAVLYSMYAEAGFEGAAELRRHVRGDLMIIVSSQVTLSPELDARIADGTVQGFIRSPFRTRNLVTELLRVVTGSEKPWYYHHSDLIPKHYPEGLQDIL